MAQKYIAVRKQNQFNDTTNFRGTLQEILADMNKYGRTSQHYDFYELGDEVKVSLYQELVIDVNP